MISKRAGIRNEKVVLLKLVQFGQLSQVQLSELTGLRSSTLSYVVGRLRDKGLILEEIGQSRRRGVKPVLLRINPQGRYAAGIEINPSRIRIALFDFSGETIEFIECPSDPQHNPERMVKTLEINLRGLIGKHAIEESKLIGIGVTLSGSISREGTVELSSPLGWKDVKLKSLLQACFSSPVSVHSTRVRILAEISPSGDTPKHILYINVANGVGTTVILDGQLLHGATNRSGELGHVIMEPDGPLCGCGHRGCLEALISGPALARRIRKDLAEGTESLLSQTIQPEDIPEIIIEKWCEAYRKNDSYALRLKAFVADTLSRAATIAINLYDPDRVILAGYVCRHDMNYWIRAIREAMAGEVYDNASRRVDVLPARGGEDALLKGVATAVLQQALQL